MSHARSTRLFAAVLLLVCPVASGCTKSDGKVSVNGHVTFRGEPLEHAAITFYPANGRAEMASVENGAYNARLEPGAYTAVVLVSPTLPPGYKEGDKIPPPKVVLPEQYTSRLKSSLTATVSAGQSDPINFDLK